VKGPVEAGSYTRLHLRFGWWSLFVFAAVGLTLETLHGFKVAVYLDLSNETRRLMWTLAHAHGVGLALIHLLFAIIVRLELLGSVSSLSLVSRCLVAASFLLPGGFFAGGAVYYGGDPGFGILLVPVGAVLFLLAVFVLARETKNMESPPSRRQSRPRS
jgi:hypothetical protein